MSASSLPVPPWPASRASRFAPFTGLLVDFAREVDAGAVVKGLRAMTDFEYELQQADLNYRLDSELESVFIMSAPQLGYLSSSVVRQVSPRSAETSPPSCPPSSSRRCACVTPVDVLFAHAWPRGGLR